MLKTQIRNQLDGIEVELTPKEWAIGLVDEIRRYPCEQDFLRVLAKGQYHESPYVKPFFMLAKQAENLHPGHKPGDESARQKSSRDLRMEFQALKSLINDISREVEIKTEKSRLKISALTSQLQGLIFHSAVAVTIERTAGWIERHPAAEPDEEERLLILKELANVGAAAGSRTLSLSLAQDWADDAAMLLMETFRQKGAVEVVQQKYFDGHEILNQRIEGALETAIQLILEAVAKFNEYVSTTGSGLSQQGVPSKDETLPAIASEQGTCTLRIDVEAIRSGFSDILIDCQVYQWVTDAKNKATADLLEETGEHGDFLWERFRESFRVKPLVQ
jgi:hypothetical protein